MQLKTARLCLDCDEVHDAQECPVCASEAFAYLTRWVPAPERRVRPRPTTSPVAEVYGELLSSDVVAPKRGRSLTRSAFGVTALVVAGWMWRRSKDWKKEQRRASTDQSPEPIVPDNGNQTPVSRGS